MNSPIWVVIECLSQINLRVFIISIFLIREIDLDLPQTYFLMILGYRFKNFHVNFYSLIILVLSGIAFSNSMHAQVGDICDTPINIASLPYTASGLNADYGNDYNQNDAPPESVDAIHDVPYLPNMINGPEVVYSYTAVADGYVAAILFANGIYASIQAYTGCPFQSVLGWDYSPVVGVSSIAGIPVEEGETYYFVLSTGYPFGSYEYSFYLNEYNGYVCEAPKNISSLPYSDSDQLLGYGNDYANADVAPASANAVSEVPFSTNYLTGDDVVYAYTPIEDGYINVESDANAAYSSIYVFTGCPFEETLGWDYSSTNNSKSLLNVPVIAGETYYFVLSTSQVSSNYNYEFSVKESSGHNCEAPFEIGVLPYMHQGNISDYSHDYDQASVPQPVANPISNGNYGTYFFNGPEVVYAYTPASDGYVDAVNMTNQDLSTLTVLTGCTFDAAVGWDYSLGANTLNREIKNIAVESGETYYFVISSSLFDADYDFAFSLQPSAGPTCEQSIEITNLPFEFEASLNFLGNDYSADDVPTVITNPIASSDLSPEYLNGIDIVYSYIPEEDQFLEASLYGLGDSMSIWIFTGCPFELTHGWGYTTTSNNLNIDNIPVAAGETYYFVVSSKTGYPFYHTFELTGSSIFDCPALEKNIGDPCDDFVNSTHGDYVRENCQCEGISLGANINLTIPMGASCGQRQAVVKTYVPEIDVPIFNVTSGFINSTEFTISNMPVGTIDIYIEIDGVLRVLLEDETLLPGVNSIELTNLILGDINASNSVNVTDFSILSSLFGTTPGDQNYNALADLNCDNTINIVDFSIMAANFGLQGVPLP